MRTSIATVCLSGSLEEKMRAAAYVGFDGIEVFEQDLVNSPLSAEQITELAGELGLSLDLYQPFRDLEGVAEHLFSENLRRLEEKFRLMQRLGMDLILICSNVSTATEGEDGLLVDQLRRAADLGAQYGIRLAYEALAWGRTVNTYEHSWSLVEQAGRDNLGVCLDSFHVLSRNSDPSGFSNIPPDKIFFLQLADAPKQQLMDLLSWSRHHRNFPGEGSFQLVNFMVELTRAGYSGPVSLEVFNDVFRQVDAVRTARDGYRSLLWLADATCAALLAAGIDPDSVVNTMGLRPLEPMAAPVDWDYVEIASDDLKQIAELLAQLGFTDHGTHRTKDVRLFSAGKARVVLNECPARVAPSIAGLGMQMPDPKSAAARASQLQVPSVRRANRADEMVLRGVHAPDGTEIFFAPASGDSQPGWSTEFGPVRHHDVARGALPVGDGGLADPELIIGIDHVNLAQPWQHFDEAVLFYTAVLGLQDHPPAEVPSPQGLVHSQVMRADDSTVRIPLNVVPHVLDGPSLLGQPLDHYERIRKSAYPQHVAFTTPDIITLAQSAQAAGLRFLPVPNNYYEDLVARFNLDNQFVDVLRENHLLFDRDAHGEFLHFYTRTLGTVFFEVVERRNGYNGYGASNAPIRMAAQYAIDYY